MLASIFKPDNLPDEDILIFLKNDEIKKLENSSLEGKIFEYKDVRNVYSLEMRVDRSLKYRPIKVKREPNRYEVILYEDNYLELKNKGWTGTRPDSYSKIDIMAESFAKQYEESERELRFIKNIWENRDKIIKKMEKDFLLQNQKLKK